MLCIKLLDINHIRFKVKLIYLHKNLEKNNLEKYVYLF